MTDDALRQLLRRGDPACHIPDARIGALTASVMDNLPAQPQGIWATIRAALDELGGWVLLPRLAAPALAAAVLGVMAGSHLPTGAAEDPAGIEQLAQLSNPLLSMGMR